MRTSLRAGLNLALAVVVGPVPACVGQADAPTNGPSTDTGGSESPSGGQAGSGGAAAGGSTNVGGTIFIEDGAVILGACTAPDGSVCRDYTGMPGFEPTQESAREHCFNRYYDTWSDSMWREGEHCPLQGVPPGGYDAILVCKNGTNSIYFYNDDGDAVLTQDEADDACARNGYGEAVYWLADE